MNYKKVVVAGGGVLGSQIAFQAAYCGFDVTIWLRSEASVGRCQPKLDTLKKNYIEDIENMAKGTDGFWARGIADKETFNKEECLAKVERAASSIKLVVDKKEAYADADLVIESMAEITEEKIAYYKDLGQYLPEKTVVVTNSSTLLPSKMASSTGRENKYLALHFANSIWKNNTAEVMAQSKTDMKYFNETLEFAKTINMIGLPVKKEKSGYLLNSMLVPFLFSAMDLLVNGVSDPESVDKAWKLATGAPNGPFEIMDVVGLITARNIVEQYQKVPSLVNPLLKKMMLPYNYKEMLKILNKYIDEILCVDVKSKFKYFEVLKFLFSDIFSTLLISILLLSKSKEGNIKNHDIAKRKPKIIATTNVSLKLSTKTKRVLKRYTTIVPALELNPKIKPELFL